VKSKEVIRKIKALCARKGSPCQLLTDNVQQFIANEFRRFTIEWDIEYLTSSPHHPKSNGMAETAIKLLNVSSTKLNKMTEMST